MASAKSNPAIDFRDAAPRFEFGVGSTKQPSTPPRAKSKKGKRFGKFGKGSKNGGKSGNGNDNDNVSPSKRSLGSSSATATTSSLNSSLETAGYDEYGDGRVHSGDIAAGPQARGHSPQNQKSPARSSQRGGGSCRYDPSSSPWVAPNTNRSPGHQEQPSGGPTGQAPGSPRRSPAGSSRHPRHPSAASTSGCISEVSEFSFDRVTVTTEGTGQTNQSSNISWGFLDDGVLAAVGGGQDKRTGTPDGPGGGRRTQKVVHHRQQPSDSTFSNVSLSSEEDMDNIPCTGIVHDGAQSVISEISERTPLGGGVGRGGTTDAVRAILEEGMEGVREKQRSPKRSPGKRTNISVFGKSSKRGLAEIKEGNSEHSPARDTRATYRSTASVSGTRESRTRTLLEDVRETYLKFKTDRNRGGREKPTILQSIIEDVQFCGLYLCGINTTRDDLGCGAGGDDESNRRRRDERKREADDTFLGKVVKCGEGYGDRCGERAGFFHAL